MIHVTPGNADARRRRRLVASVKGLLGELRNQLSLFNRQVGAQDLKDVDMDCLDLINRHGQLSPTALARRAGLHPATMTCILDRLERSGCITRERAPSDRRRDRRAGPARPQCRTLQPALEDEHLDGPDLRRIHRYRTRTTRRLPAPHHKRRTERD
jgi:hypothetical protein